MTLCAKHVTKTFGKRQQPAMKEGNLILCGGTFLCLRGVSGCGKSTLLNALSGLLPPTTGIVSLNGINMYQEMHQRERTLMRNQQIGYMTQRETLLEQLSVYDNIVLPITLRHRTLYTNRLEKLMDDLKIGQIKNRLASELSGGEYRRVMLARTVFMQPEFLLLDEPTSNLDAESARLVRKTITEYCSLKTGVLVATHDDEMANIKLPENIIRKEIELF